MRKRAFIIFFSIVLSIYTLINLYIFTRGWEVIPENASIRLGYAVLYSILFLSFIVGRVLERVALSWFSDVLVWIGSFWLGAIDFLRLINSIVPFFPSFLTANDRETGQVGGGRVKDFYKCRENRDQPIGYSVITLNYDMVLENICTFINERYGGKGQISFKSSYDKSGEISPTGRFLAKLHGSVDTKDMVPPTWNKIFRSRTILDAWRLAYKLLTDANHIRVIGYSLPTADTYVKYLLKAAVMDAPHLKTIDVVCLDPSGDVRNRYKKFITFPSFRFINADVLGYLEETFKKRNLSGDRRRLTFDRLETAHQSFQDKHSSTV